MVTYSSVAHGFNTWSFILDGPSQDCYLDSNQGDTDCNTLESNNNDYIATGFNNSGNQIAFFKYDLSDVINTIKTYLPDDAFIVVTSATLNAKQSSENPNNPNNPRPTTLLGTSLSPQRIVGFRGRETLKDWDEMDSNFTYNNYFNTGNLNDQLGTTNLISGGIAADYTGLTTNIFTGTNLNERLTAIIGNAVEEQSTKSDLSFAIQSTSGFNLPFEPFNLFPIEDLVSSEIAEETDPETDMSLALDIAIFTELDFDLFARAGTSDQRFDDWEAALRNNNNNNLPIVEADFEWRNGRDANRIFFELNYDDMNGNAQLILFRNDQNGNPLPPFFDRTIDTDPNNAGAPSIEGLKLYTSIRTAYCRPGDSSSGILVAPGTNSRLRLTSITDGNGNGVPIPISLGSVDAFVPNNTSIPMSNHQEVVIPFFDIGVDKAQQVKGNFTIGWDGGENPQTSCGQRGGRSRVQMLLEPLTTLPDTRPMSMTTDSEFLSAFADDVGVKSVPEPATVIGLLLFGLAGVGLGRSSDQE
jgi:hypothetical protein